MLSVCAIVLAALWFLVPSGAGENILKYAMGVFIISVIISTLNISFANTKNELPAINTDTVIVKAQSISNETAKFVLENLLYQCSIKFKEIEIIMDNSNPSDINITKARVEFIDNDDFVRAAEIVKKQTGIILVR